MGRHYKIYGKRLLNALFLTSQNFANSQLCQKQSNSRCSWVCIQTYTRLVGYRQTHTPQRNSSGRSRPLCVWQEVYTYISAWASALLVLTEWAMRRPCDVGRVTSTDSHVFRIRSPSSGKGKTLISKAILLTLNPGSL